MKSLFPGIYEALLDESLKEALVRHPELRSIFGKIDPEEQPARYAAFAAKVIEQALREEADPEKRLELCNRLMDSISFDSRQESIRESRLVPSQKPLLLEITPPNYLSRVPRPHTPLAESSLFTGSPREPQLVHELQAEMHSADGVDILVSFIKWTGLRLLMQAFEDLRDRKVPVRLITTSYTGASDPSAVEWLAKMPNVRIRISYDTERTRLHAKAYHFMRQTGFSTAYIGSANMSHAAITSGLEWNLKITAQDMGHILKKFSIEFETYWNSREFVLFDPCNPAPFRKAIDRARHCGKSRSEVFFDLNPYPFQDRILEALERERNVHGRRRNLVIAATGTGKTVVAAFDFHRFYLQQNKQCNLLFLAHREQILQQALATFRNVLRDHNFGELLVGNCRPDRIEHLFCSVPMLSSRRLWEQVEKGFYDYIIIDEAHHGTASSYRPIFEHFSPKILLGLTATPERMDGGNVAADFGNRFAAEIRLPEALEEKLLCPFHYFGVGDPVSLRDEKFWRNGRYDVSELEKVYTGVHELARRRLEVIQQALLRYQPDLGSIKGIGFCVSIGHARFMAAMFTKWGIPSEAYVSGNDEVHCAEMLGDLQSGRLIFLFTVDKLSEGVDLPEVNTILFLRPTDSLTVFIQQLGRGLRHAPEKDCLMVLDFVGQAHRRYRLDIKLKALLPKQRYSIDREVEESFPHLPAGCSIQLDKLSRDYIIENIRENLRRLAIQVPDRLQTFGAETGQDLTFGNFIKYHDYEAETLLARETWTSWKAKALLGPIPDDPDITRLKKTLVRAASMTGPKEISLIRRVIEYLAKGDVADAIEIAGDAAISIYYRMWGDKGGNVGIVSLEDAFEKLSRNTTILKDLDEVLDWAESETPVSGHIPELPFSCPFELHANYGMTDILAGLGQANIEKAGQRGIGVIPVASLKTYALLVTFQKTEREFSPSTMYADYPISRELLHWESQSNTTQRSESGKNLIFHEDRGYTILVFARGQKKRNGCTVPFAYLGPAERVSYEGEKPIKMVWKLHRPIPVDMYEENRRGG
ncbi:MAG: DUF3427 domain-containing protein [Syntrophobacteraceae bacterium]